MIFQKKTEVRGGVSERRLWEQVDLGSATCWL